MEDEVRPLLATEHNYQINFLPWDPSRARKSGILILFSVIFERLAFYAVVMNLFLYLNRGQPLVQSWDPINALTAVFVINGVTCLSAPLGGILSDSLIGRFWAVVLGTVFYIIGYMLLTALSINKLTSFGCDLKPKGFGQLLCGSSHPCSPHVYVILVLIGIGVGCVRANIAPFLAEQVRVGSQNAVRQFFNAYYWCANLGAVVGVGILSYVMEEMDNGFFIAFVTATSALCASLVFFCCGRCFYVIHRPGKSVILNIFRIMAEGTKNTCRKNLTSSSPVMRRVSATSSGVSLALGPPSWVDRAKVTYGGSFHDATVDDVKRLARNMAFILLLVPYWLVYFQMSTLFQAQGLHMQVGRNGTTENFLIPSAWLTLGDELFILVLIPLLTFLIYPLLDRWGVGTAPLNRIMIGMVASLAAVVTAGIVEYFRLVDWNEGHVIIQVISNTKYNASSMPILWQIPQYCLIGTAEVMAGVAGLEFAYTTAPRTFQGVVMGLYWAFEGLASFLGVLLVKTTQALHLNWIRSDVNFNQGHLDFFFYLLASIQLLAIVILALVVYARWESPQHVDQNQRQRLAEVSLAASALHSEFYGAVGHQPDISTSDGSR